MAAVKVQSVQRGRMSRRQTMAWRANAVGEAKRRQTAILDGELAAVRIQAVHRGREARREAKLLQERQLQERHRSVRASAIRTLAQGAALPADADGSAYPRDDLE